MNRAQRGLTLIEVLVAVAMLMALTTVMFSFFTNVLESRMHVIEFTDKQRAADSIIERLESDLITTLAGDNRLGPGLDGDANSLRLLSRGVATYRAARGEDDPGAFGDLQLAEYVYRPVDRTLLARRESIDTGLARDSTNADREDAAPPGMSPLGAGDELDGEPFNPFDHSDFDADDEADASGLELIGRDLGRVRLRYHDGDGWREAFNSLDAGGLPVAVEITIWFEPWPGEEDRAEAERLRDEQLPQRETFDYDPVFDEDEYLREQELADRPEPEPDRRRVIVIPDAREADEPNGDDARRGAGVNGTAGGRNPNSTGVGP